jgi:mono/diheme cytochrome c family protein/uncharacterized membrane protein
MPTFCTHFLFILAGFMILPNLGERPLFAQQAANGTAARELFQQRCAKCHGADGTGSPTRGPSPEIPDFTAASWQTRRSDAQLVASILDGRGNEMPAFRGRINEGQARDLVALVRVFAPTMGKPGPKKDATSAGGFEEEMRRLQKEMEELRRQFRQASEEALDQKSSRQAASPPQAVSRPGVPAAAETVAVPELFRQRCGKCHETDGTGSGARARMPEVPDFTDPAWQARRSEAQLLASILDGKGEDMPPFRDKIGEEQARSLVAHVRAFAAAAPAKQGKEEPGDPPPDENADVQPARGFFEKLIAWLGKFHPAAVHFPIALLTAAAVAELLQLATGQAAFDAMSRYSVWFGTLSAVVAGSLGWFLGGFRLTDASWVLTTHRWLGTATVVCATLVLVLSELSRRSERRRTRMWFRVTLLALAALVAVTGYFGGAVVFGLDHYAWPS